MRTSFKATDNYSNVFWGRDKNKTWPYLLMQFCNYSFFVFARRLFFICPEVSFVFLFHKIPLATHSQPVIKACSY